MKMMPVSNESKLGIQAFVAVLIVTVITESFGFTRSYWGILTVVALVAPSVGESIQRAYKRLLMTVLGCGCGWILYLVLPDLMMVFACVLVVSIFLAIYFVKHSYAKSMFFIGIFVVFLFGSLVLNTVYRSL